MEKLNLQQRLTLRALKTKLLLQTAVSPASAGKAMFKLFCKTRRPKLRDDYPILAKGKAISLQYDGLAVRGKLWNENGKETALILHGFSSSYTQFHNYISELVEKDFRVIAIDAPANGSSDGRSVHALAYSEVIEAVMEQFGPVHNVIAHSFGGLALCLALERIGNYPVNKIVLIAPATETSTALEHAFTLLNVKSKKLRKAINAEIEKLSGKPTEWFSVKRAIQHISIPVLWVHDKKDSITPYIDIVPVMKNMQANIDFFVTEGLGHSKIYKTAAVQNRIVDFIVN